MVFALRTHVIVKCPGYVFKPPEEAELKPLAKRAMEDAVGCFLEGRVEVSSFANEK